MPGVSNGGVLAGPETIQENEGNAEIANQYITGKFLPGITNSIVVFLLGISVIMFVIAGVIYLVSAGDTDMTKKAKDTMIWTVIGIFVVAFAYAIVKFVTNIDFLN